jgi:hypothetical protein
MKLQQLSEDGVTKERKQTSAPKTRVWQTDKHQGKKCNAAKSVGPETKPYRWGTGKPMSGDGYKEAILKPGR